MKCECHEMPVCYADSETKVIGKPVSAEDVQRNGGTRVPFN
jgi:hypothetical protein